MSETRTEECAACGAAIAWDRLGSLVAPCVYPLFGAGAEAVGLVRTSYDGAREGTYCAGCREVALSGRLEHAGGTSRLVEQLRRQSRAMGAAVAEDPYARGWLACAAWVIGELA